MPHKRTPDQSTNSQWHFRECGDHFHAEIELKSRMFPCGTLTKGCCWPTAHALEPSPYGFSAKPTKAELMALLMLEDCMPPTAIGHALGLAAAYHQHRLGGVRPPAFQGDWQADNGPFAGSSFPCIGVAIEADDAVCPLLLLGIRGDRVDVIPLVNWPQTEGLDIAAGHVVLSMPARAVVADPELAVATCFLWRNDISDAEERREKISALLHVIYPHIAPDPEMAQIFVAGLLHRHLATDTSGKFDQECREILSSLSGPNGERFLTTQTGVYLAIVYELQRWVEPLEKCLKSGGYKALAAEMNLPIFAPRLAMMLEDLQMLQQGIQPYLHREPSEQNQLVAGLLIAGPEEKGARRDETHFRSIAAILHRVFSRTITHTINHPLGAFFQAMDDYLDRDPPVWPKEARH